MKLSEKVIPSKIPARSALHKLRQAIACWDLTSDGLPFQTQTSVLQYVLVQGKPAVLKVALCEEERRGAEVLRWWNGERFVERILSQRQTCRLRGLRTWPILVDAYRAFLANSRPELLSQIA